MFSAALGVYYILSIVWGHIEMKLEVMGLVLFGCTHLWFLN